MDTIIRGTNACVRIHFKNTVDLSRLTNCELHITQGELQIVKTFMDLFIDVNRRIVSYRFTQEETLAFTAGKNVNVVLVGMIDNNRFETRPIIMFSIDDTIKNEVMS